MSQKTDWSAEYRRKVGQLLDTLADLREYQRSYDALGLSAGLLDEDCLEPGYGISADQLRGAVASVQAIDNYITSNFHTTILYTVKR